MKYVGMKAWLQITSGCCIMISPTRHSSENQTNEESNSDEYHILVFDTRLRI